MSNAPSQQFSLNLDFIGAGQTDRATHEREDREIERMREWLQATRVGVMIPAPSSVIAFSWAVAEGPAEMTKASFLGQTAAKN